MSDEEASQDSVEDLSASEIFDQLEEEGLSIPEEDKKRLVISGVQETIQSELEDDEEAWKITIMPTIDSLYTGLKRKIGEINRLTDELSNIDEEDRVTDVDEETAERFLVRAILADDVLTFFVVAQDAIETFSIQLLHDELVVEPYRDSNETMKLLDRKTGQPQREGYLKRFGLLDHQIVDKMEEVRNLRNDLVHDLQARQALDFEDELMVEVDKAMEVLNKFHEEFNGEKYWEDK